MPGMSDQTAALLIGAGILPATALAALLLWMSLMGSISVYRRFLSWKLVPLQRCYAYQVTAASGRLAHDLIGTVFVERRNLGPEHTFYLEHDGENSTTATATRVAGGGTYRGRWDHETASILDGEASETEGH